MAGPPLLLPLKVSVSTSGRISVELVAQWVTPLGTFAISSGDEHTFTSTRSKSYRRVIRTVEKRPA